MVDQYTLTGWEGPLLPLTGASPFLFVNGDGQGRYGTGLNLAALRAVHQAMALPQYQSDREVAILQSWYNFQTKNVPMSDPTYANDPTTRPNP